MATSRLAAVLLTAIAFADPAMGGERLRVAIPSAEQERVGDLLERMASAVTDEDYDSYLACLTTSARTRGQRISAEDFVASDLGLEIGKWVIETSTPTKIQIVLAYTLTKDGHDERFVSTVDCVPHADRILFDREKSRRISSESTKPTSSSTIVCKGGRCAIAPPPPPGNKPRIPLSLFNDADGNPDPNGIMWIDPRKLMQAFPEKYAGCGALVLTPRHSHTKGTLK